MKNIRKRGCAVLLIAMLLLGTFAFTGFSEDAVSALPTDFYTAIVGAVLTLPAGEDVLSVSAGRPDIADVSFVGGAITVAAKATGDTPVTITHSDGSAATVDVYTYASQAQYDYLNALFRGKVVSVLGDSISTLEPWDDGGSSRYYDMELVDDCGEDGVGQGGIPIRLRDTYWGSILTRFGMTPGNVVSWRGKTVVGWMEDDAQIDRLGKNGAPDVIFFYGGTNDVRKKEAIDVFRASYDNVLAKLQAGYPHAKLIALLPCAPSSFAPYSAAASEVCASRSVEYVRLADSGVTALHPDADGFSKEVGCILDTLYADSVNAGTDTPTEPVTQTEPAAPTAPAAAETGACKYCGGTHTGFPGVLIGFFHSILALFGLRK